MKPPSVTLEPTRFDRASLHRASFHRAILCWISLLAFALPSIFFSPSFAQEATTPTKLNFDPGKVFDETWEIVQQNFYDENFNGVDWLKAKQEYRPQALKAQSRDEFAAIMSQMLQQLKTSHTAYYPTSDPRSYQLLGVFEFLAKNDQLELLQYEGIGIATVTIDDRIFVQSVFDGMPAARSGILFGDEIVAVNAHPFHPIESFRGMNGRDVSIEIRRKPNAATEKLSVAVEHLNGRTMFETALQNSARIISHRDRKIAYLHVWSYAGTKYQEKIKELLLFGSMSTADALVLDLRDGLGGASLEYLNLFQAPIAQLTTRSRTGATSNYSGVWGKPVALLVNSRSTSGKELFTYGFQKLKLGRVVGEKTAGAVVAGRPFLLSNSDVLYLAVTDIKVDGERIEGKGVMPTDLVDRPLPYAAGADPQLDRALELLLENK